MPSPARSADAFGSCTFKMQFKTLYCANVMSRFDKIRGGYRVFQKGGLRPAIRNAGGGVLSALDPTRNAGGRGGGGAVHLSI